MGSHIDVNADVFRETSVVFLKCVENTQNIAKVMSTWISKVHQNSTAFKK